MLIDEICVKTIISCLIWCDKPNWLHSDGSKIHRRPPNWRFWSRLAARCRNVAASDELHCVSGRCLMLLHSVCTTERREIGMFSPKSAFGSWFLAFWPFWLHLFLRFALLVDALSPAKSISSNWVGVALKRAEIVRSEHVHLKIGIERKNVQQLHENPFDTRYSAKKVCQIDKNSYGIKAIAC